jgi:alpha-mannosidase
MTHPARRSQEVSQVSYDRQKQQQSDGNYRKLGGMRVSATSSVVPVLAISLGFCFLFGSTRMWAASSVPMEQMTLHVIPQSHIDIAWWWRYDPETIHVVVKRTLELAFENLDKHPDYTFSFLQVPAIQPMERFYPELFYKFHYYLFHSKPLNFSIPNPHETTPAGPSEEKGRLKLVHGLWLESDGCLPAGESVVRQCLYGKRYFKYQFGIDVKTAWFADCWTHPWTYPQILKKSGIDSYLFQRSADGQDQERMFWWQAPDGSRVFAYKPASFNGLPTRERWERELSEVSKRYGVKNHIALMGVGDHGGGAPEGDIEMMKKVMASMPTKASFSTPAKFLEAVLSEKTDFPVVNYEISGVDRGAYTTAGEIKKGNRQRENLLLTLEKFSSLATKLSEGEFRYPQDELNASWEKVMLNQTHDTISGTNILPSIDDALKLYQEVLDGGRKNVERALLTISSKINTEGQGIPVVVFNPLSWERNDLVQTDLEFPDSVGAVDLVDSQVRQIPVQIIGQNKRNGKHHLEIVFVAEGVPSVGYKTYRVNPRAAGESTANPLKAGEREIENEYFRLQIDSVSGCLKSVLDKRHGREVLDKAGRGNLIQILEDFGNSEGHLKSPDGKIDFRHKWPGRTWDVDSNPELKLLETGPVRAVIQIKKKFGLARFTQMISLYSKIPRIDFDLVIDWEGQNRMVKVSFPTRVAAPEATYEIPYGTIRRPSNGEEHAAQKWVDISDQDYGVSLLNDSRYGYDVKDNVIRLSVLRSPTAPIYSTDERGVRTLRYSLYPHKGSWQEGDVMPRAYELNNPLIPFVDSVHSGDLPTVNSFLKVEPKNIIVEVVKKAEDSNDLILRLYETEGRKCTAKVTFEQPLDAVHRTDLLENSLSEVTMEGKSFQVPVGAYAIESFKLISDKLPDRR